MNNLLLVHFTTPFPNPAFLPTLQEELKSLKAQNFILMAACPWPELLKPTVDSLEEGIFYNADDYLTDRTIRKGKWGFQAAYVVGENRREIIRLNRNTPPTYLHLRPAC